MSFTFDDFPRSAYLTGGAILERFGLRGTYYAAPALMNTSSELGEQFLSEDIDSLLDKGHELGSHTFTHISSRSVPCARFGEDVEKGRRAIEEMSAMDSSNFAYPFGDVTFEVKRTLEWGLGSARSIIPGFNGPEIDLNLLRANSLYGDTEAAAYAEKLIAENSKRRSWLIFYTHDVRPNPSLYGCTAALLESAASCAVQSGARILTVGEALADVGVGSGSGIRVQRKEAPQLV